MIQFTRPVRTRSMSTIADIDQAYRRCVAYCVDIGHCTQYSVQCTLYTVVYSVHVQCSVHCIHVHYIVFSHFSSFYVNHFKDKIKKTIF